MNNNDLILLWERSHETQLIIEEQGYVYMPWIFINDNRVIHHKENLNKPIKNWRKKFNI